MRVCPECHALYGADTARCPRDGLLTLAHDAALVGRSLGPFRVLQPLGEGGMGIVYAGQHESIGRRVALKVLRPELSLRDDIVDAFVQEARAVSTIGHENIVKVYDFGRTPFGSFYIVMEFLQGATVRQLLQESGPQPLERVLMIVDAVAAALGAAHAKGFIHRDVKPENIMLCYTAGRAFAKLLDFGIAKLLMSSAASTVAPPGTPAYMAPELLEGRAAGPSSDIFSLGVVAYEMLTGVLPFPGGSEAEVIKQQRRRLPVAPSVLRGPAQPIPESVDRTVLRCIAREPERRFASVDALRGFDAPADVRCRGAPSPWRRGLMVAGVLLLLLSVGSIIWLTATRSGRRQPSRRIGASKSQAGDVTAAPSLVAVAADAGVADANSAAWRARWAAVVGDLGCTELEGKLRSWLQDEDPRVRRNAAKALGDLGRVSPKTKAALRAAAKPVGGNPWLRLEFARALARLGEIAPLRRFHRSLRRARPMLRVRVLEALAASGDAEGQALAKHLANTTVVTRIRRLGYLARLRETAAGKRAHAELTAMLGGRDWRRRLLAAQSLIESSPELAMRQLRGIAQKGPRAMRVDAAAYLARSFHDNEAAVILSRELPTANDEQAYRIVVALGRLRDPRVARSLQWAQQRGAAPVRLAARLASGECGRPLRRGGPSAPMSGERGQPRRM